MIRTVAAVEYVNAKPLIGYFDSLGDLSPVRVLEDVPSRLPDLLESGEAEAILVSSYYALAVPHRRIAEGCAIATYGPAESVRLFSKVEFSQIKSLALDRSSMTSNGLAQIVLADRYGAHPETTLVAPALDSMLKDHDAALLIGDKGMTADGHGLREIDLGSEWTALTGLPFVWALWVGDSYLSPELVATLIKSRDWGIANLDSIVATCGRLPGWSPASAAHYLAHTMSYVMTDWHLTGLHEFQTRLTRHGLLHDSSFPIAVSPHVAHV